MVLASIDRESRQLGASGGMDVDFVLQTRQLTLNGKGEFHLTDQSFILAIHSTQFPRPLT